MKPVQILVADDHLSVRTAIKRLLKSLPHVVIVAEASDGEEAVELAKQHRPDVVLMDVSMPRVNGLEATRRILRDVPEVAILVVTAHRDDEMMDAAFRAGAVGYLLKTQLEELPSAVEAVCRGERFIAARVESAE